MPYPNLGNLNPRPDLKFTDRYLMVIDPATKVRELRYKSQREGNLSLVQSMELLKGLLKRYEMEYRTTDQDPKILLFPYMFKEPPVGSKILNEDTGETYEVDQIIKNPKTDLWEGLIKLDLNFAPNFDRREFLTFVDEDNYVYFDHLYRTTIPNDIVANTDGVDTNTSPMEPVVTWNLMRKEPGARGPDPFGPKRELKPSLRDTVKDPLAPGYSVQILGQYFDNIVQFDAWNKNNISAEALIEWFDQFMRLSRKPLMQHGVSQIFFWKRQEDSLKREWQQPIWRRGIQYYLRTEQLEVSYERDILRVNVSIGNESSAIPDQSPRYIADQLVTGHLTSSGYRNLFYDSSGNYRFGDLTILQ